MSKFHPFSMAMLVYQRVITIPQPRSTAEGGRRGCRRRWRLTLVAWVYHRSCGGDSIWWLSFIATNINIYPLVTNVALENHLEEGNQLFLWAMFSSCVKLPEGKWSKLAKLWKLRNGWERSASPIYKLKILHVCLPTTAQNWLEIS